MSITRGGNTWFGLSTDTKPTNTSGTSQLGIPSTGDIFRETDTGKSYTWSGSAWGILNAASTTSDSSGNNIALVPSALGFLLPITPQPDCLLIDNFNGTTIDTVNRWLSPVLAGGGTMTQAGGALVATLGTTASNGAAISSIENYEPSIGAINPACLMAVEAAPGINTNRCYGAYTRPGSFTAATPVQDGYVWELDITGAFGASIYSGGVRISRTLFPLGGATLLPLQIAFQALNVNFYFGSTTVPVLTVPIAQPSTLSLPFGFHAINHTSGPAGAPTWSMSAAAVIDQSGTQLTVWNGQAFSRQRSPSTFININALSIAAEATIWTPAAGRKFRLMGYVLESGTIGGNVLLKDNTGGTTRLIVPFGAANGVIVSPPMGNGILSAAVNNVLTATGTATQTLSGYVFGCEE